MARETAPVTALLAFALVAAYAAELALGGLPVCEAYGLVPAVFGRTGDLVPLFSHAFLHDPEAPFGHLGGNVLVLLLAGSIVERELGSVRFLALYTAAGLLGGLLHIAVDSSSSVPLIGASGAISGVLAVLGVLRPRLLGFVAGFVGWNVWLAWSGAAGDVSFATHIAGFSTGALYCVTAHLSQKERSFTF
jgi:membrane associated rhomboid family serine protease